MDALHESGFEVCGTSSKAIEVRVPKDAENTVFRLLGFCACQGLSMNQNGRVAEVFDV